MQELILSRGIPASGKSTYARAWVAAAPNRVRVNRDDIRMQMYGVWHGENVNEDAVTIVEDSMIKSALSKGFSVIVDDCNIAAKYVKRLAALGHAVGAQVSIKTFPVKIDEALRRNAARERKVPEDVIVNMHRRLVMGPEIDISAPVIEPYVANDNLPVAYMFDIDGTLAKMSGRSPYDESRVLEDEVVEAVAEVAAALNSAGYEIIVMSGRSSDCRSDTIEWLRRNGIRYTELFMRKSGDNRKDSIVKTELFDEHVRHQYNVLAVFDDRNQVVDMWRAMGLPCFQVAPGDF